MYHEAWSFRLKMFGLESVCKRMVVLFRRLSVFVLIAYASVGIGDEESTDGVHAHQSSHPLEGTLVFNAKNIEITEHARVGWFPEFTEELPPIEVELVVSGSNLIPANRGLVTTDHDRLDYIVSAGSIQQEGEELYAGLPFTIVNRVGNCTHNGVIRFKFNDSIQDGSLVVNQETCHFVKVDIEADLEIDWKSHAIKNRDEVIESYELEVASRLPVQSIETLVEKTGTDISKLMDVLPKDDGLSILGVYFDGIHYTTECRTRGEPYPYCDEMLFTSFSTAKSTFPAVVLLRLAQQYGLEVYDTRITKFIPETKSSLGSWREVTFDHVGDMASGNFNIKVPMADPSPGNFYADLDEAGKLAAALSWSDGAPPGSQFIYQTADTFILTVALNRFIESLDIGYDDAYKYLVAEVFEPLNLSDELADTRRTQEEGIPNSGSAFGGMGMWFNRDGIARLSKLLLHDGGMVGDTQVLHPDALAETLQRNGPPHGLATNFFGTYYNNGMWALPVHEILPDAFECDVWVPYMSGLSGVRVTLLPNDVIIYYFNDTQSFPIAEVIEFGNQLKSICHD